MTNNQSPTGAICGGVVSWTTFFSDPMTYMMAWVLPDGYFSQYEYLLKNGERDKASAVLRKYGRSMI